MAEHYQWYHRPQGFGLTEVRESIETAVKQGARVALNLLFFPGFNNQAAETEALYELIAASGLQQVQLRNLNLDPERLQEKLAAEENSNGNGMVGRD